jgi:hypothetical protein
VTLSDKLESGILDITTESLIFFCGSDIQSVPSPKLEASITSTIQRIRDLENPSTQTIRKYCAYILENLIQGKLLTPRDHLLLTGAVSSGILKLLEEKVNPKKEGEVEIKDLNSSEFELYKEKKSSEMKELQRKIENSAITLEETRAELTR